jgi:hypothetical protein
MKITEEIKEQKNDKLPEDKGDELFYAMLNGKTIEDTIKTSRGDFVVKVPKQQDIERIGLLTAQRHCGIPATSFDVNTENSIYKCAVLDVMIESGPVWYENIKKKHDNFSWREMPDTDYVDEVFVKVRSFRDKVQEQLRRIEKPLAGETDPKDVQKAVGSNLFSGIAGTDSGN